MRWGWSVADLTDEQAEALGRRWLAAGGEWVPGMLWGNFRIHDVKQDPRGFMVVSRGNGWTAPGFQDGWPDFRDPATRGAALQVVRERLGCPTAWMEPGEEGWWLFFHQGDVLTARWGPTEAHALVAAMEAAQTTPPRDTDHRQEG